MAGINHLREIYESKGDDFLKGLLNNYVIINEKVDGSFFGVKKDQKTDNFKYFKKNGEITYVDRVLTKYYNPAIAHMQSIEPEKVERIPSSLYFGFQYLTGKDNSAERYDNLPKNNLTLTFIHKYGKDGEIEETYQNGSDLNKWADFLDVEKPPIIFEGMLSDEQKEAIMEFVYSPMETLFERFKTDSFTRFIVNLLCPDKKEAYLMNRELDGIDSIVFRFYDETQENPKAETYLAKLVDPLFQEREVSQDKSRENRSNDYIWLILIDLMNFIEIYNTQTLKSYCGDEDTKDFDKRYVNLMNCVFKDFIKKMGPKYEGLQLDTPDYLKRDEFAVDMDMVGDKEIKKLITNNETYAEIYRILINFFNKTRKKVSSGFFTPELINQLNLQVNKIKNIIMGDEIYESLFPSFNEFVGNDSDDSYLIGEDVFEKKRDSLKKAKLVNVIIDDFQPITLAHIKAAEKLKSVNNHKIVLIAIKKAKPTKKAPLAANSVKNLLTKVKNEYSDLIEDIKFVNASQIEDLVKALRPEYELCLLGTNGKKLKDYVLQLDHIKKRDIPLSLSNKFKLVETPNFGEDADCLELIKNSDYMEYKKIVPKSIASEFFNLQKEISPNSLNEAEKALGGSLRIEEEVTAVDSIILEETNEDIIDEQFYSMGSPTVTLKGNDPHGSMNMASAGNVLKNLSIDDLINLTSAMIDGVPGIGNLISAGIDVAHAISYGARYFLAKDDESKITNAMMGIITLGTTVVPVGGNFANIVASQGIKKALALTPQAIKKILGMPTTLNLSKSIWKYCIVALLFRLTRSNIVGWLIEARNNLKKISSINILGSSFGSDKQVILAVTSLINELIEIAKQCTPNYSELDNHIPGKI
jgi:hypothetical protein